MQTSWPYIDKIELVISNDPYSNQFFYIHSTSIYLNLTEYLQNVTLLYYYGNYYKLMTSYVRQCMLIYKLSVNTFARKLYFNIYIYIYLINNNIYCVDINFWIVYILNYYINCMLQLYNINACVHKYFMPFYGLLLKS